MIQHEYGFGLKTGMTIDEADSAVREALAEEGFGVLTEIDVAATLKAKLGIDRSPYRILGACNPVLANEALGIDHHLGLLLPCNVIVYESDDGVTIEALDPALMSQISGGDLSAIAAEARVRLERALATLDGR